MKIVNKCMSTQYILMIGIFILLSCNCISENSIFKRDFINFENIDRIDLDANVDADADNEIDLQESKSDNEVKKLIISNLLDLKKKMMMKIMIIAKNQ